jgi:uncharacterized lipoprotein YmbA
MTFRTRKTVLRSGSLALALVGGVLALACSSPAVPERAYYLLRGEGSAVLPPAMPEQRAGISKVSVAPYLDRAGLVLATGPNEVREARYHLWAEPLQRGIRYYLEEQISSKLGYRIGGGPSAQRSWQRLVEIDIREFHGTSDGNVKLTASVTVTSAAGEVLAIEEISARTTQTEAGYPALVAAHIMLLGEAADAIAPLLR